MPYSIPQTAKAWVAAVLALLGAVAATFPESAAGKAAVLAADFVVTLGATFATPNAPRTEVTENEIVVDEP